MNPYLTLHVAHSYLYDGARERFWELLQAVLSFATTTLTFPEAIHPHSGGGCMGDGHHGWVAAEIVLAMRDAFVHERWVAGDPQHDLVLLGGIPAEWFAEGRAFALRGAPIPEGTLNMEIESRGGTTLIRTSLKENGARMPGRWQMRVPFDVVEARVNGKTTPYQSMEGGCRVQVDAGVSDRLEILLRRDVMAGSRP
jgi:hypothetical protein